VPTSTICQGGAILSCFLLLCLHACKCTVYSYLSVTRSFSTFTLSTSHDMVTLDGFSSEYNQYFLTDLLASLVPASAVSNGICFWQFKTSRHIAFEHQQSMVILECQDRLSLCFICFHLSEASTGHEVQALYISITKPLQSFHLL
jgi:hypothetical protein